MVGGCQSALRYRNVFGSGMTIYNGKKTKKKLTGCMKGRGRVGGIWQHSLFQRLFRGELENMGRRDEFQRRWFVVQEEFGVVNLIQYFYGLNEKCQDEVPGWRRKRE